AGQCDGNPHTEADPSGSSHSRPPTGSPMCTAPFGPRTRPPIRLPAEASYHTADAAVTTHHRCPYAVRQTAGAEYHCVVMSEPAPGSRQRTVWALSLVVFVALVGFQSFSPFLPLYVRELGVTDPGRIALWSGVLSAVTPAMSGVLSPLFGRLADRFGRKAMLIRSLAGFIVIIGAMGLVTSVEQLLVARVLQGLFAGFSPMAMAVASVSAPRDKVSGAIARVQGAQLLTMAIGPA